MRVSTPQCKPPPLARQRWAVRRAPNTGTAGSDETDAGWKAGHVLVACDKFKGTLSAREVAACIADGIRAVAPRVPVVAVPVADGGDCTLVAVEESGFEGIPVTVDGPTGEAVLTRYAARVSAYDLTCRSWYDLTCRSRRIREAMERGEFDNLPGAGRPLDLGVPGRERSWAERRLDQEDLSGVLPGPSASVGRSRTSSGPSPTSPTRRPRRRSSRTSTSASPRPISSHGKGR